MGLTVGYHNLTWEETEFRNYPQTHWAATHEPSSQTSATHLFWLMVSGWVVITIKWVPLVEDASCLAQ